MRVLLVVSLLALGCGGAAKAEPAVASEPSCALAVSFGNQSAYPFR